MLLFFKIGNIKKPQGNTVYILSIRPCKVFVAQIKFCRGVRFFAKLNEEVEGGQKIEPTLQDNFLIIAVFS
jgi:hypothetical protein